MPQTLTAEQLEAAGGPIAAGLLPAWRIKWVVLSQEQIDTLDERKPGPNLAIVQSIAERRMATVNVVTPFPDNESLVETLNHELGHVWIAPITAQIPDTEASVMLEEQLVETLSVYLSSLSLSARAAARRALASVVDECSARTRAKRILAGAAKARIGGPMDPKMVTEALEALIGGDTEKCAEILKGMIAQAAGGAAPASEPDGDEGMAGKEMGPPAGAPPAAAKEPAAGAPPAGPPTQAEPAARSAARLAAIDGEHLRARKAADASVGIAVRARLREIRQDGVQLPTNLEASLAKMTDLDAFEQRVSDLLEGRKLASTGTRARTGVESVGGHARTPAPTDDAPGADVAIPDAAALKAEGLPEPMIEMIGSAAKHSKKNAVALLEGARARRAQLGHANRRNAS